MSQVRRRGKVAALVLAFAAFSAASPVRAEPVELELLLAVDASSSVDPGEYRLQMQGLAAAFRHPAVRRALAQVGEPGIVVALLQWSRPDSQNFAVPWTRVRDAASLEALAAAIDTARRGWIAGGTAIARALDVASEALAANRFEGRRRVIDLSGDGRANMGGPPAVARDRATAQGVTINALAIVNEEWRLDRYYRDEVIGGTGAFVMVADDYDDFARAIRAKLVREIAGTPVALEAGNAAGVSRR